MAEKGKILVVEDDPLVSEVIEAALDGRYETVTVETSEQALATLAGDEIALLLLDCTLPGGVDPHLIPEADRRGTKVILMSGDPGRMEKLVDQPRPFVLKPFSLDGLVEAVDSVLSPPETPTSQPKTA